jgi:hypothetical protein
MESLIAAVARALEAGDPLGALNRAALRDDAAAPALRGIAMVQYGFPERDSDEREVRIGVRNGGRDCPIQLIGSEHSNKSKVQP